jgi:hypothetical protein
VADVEANVEITVEGAGGLRDAAAEAEALKEALDQDRDAALEAAAAQDALKHSTSGSANEAKRLRDEIGMTAGELQQKLPQIASVGQDAQARLNSAARDIEKMGAGGGKGASGFEQLQRDMGTYRSEAEKAAEATASLERDIRSTGLSGGESAVGGHGALDKYASDLEKLKADLADAEPRISSMNSAIDQSARDSGIAAHAMGNWHGALSDLGSGGDIGTAVRSSEELDGALGDMRKSGDEAARVLGDLTGRGGGGGGTSGGGLLGDFASYGKKAASVASDIGSGFKDLGSQAFGQVSGAGMPAMVAGLASAATTIGPALLSLGTGAAAFGALAYPAFYKVKQGLTNVTTAQQAYTQAQAVAQRDPTKANVTAEQKALDSLKATWSTMPAPIAASVKAIQSFGHAWSQAGKKSGIQQDFLKDIPKAINDAKGLIPATTKLAQGFAPVISGMLGDFGKFEKSKGFNKFVSNITSQIPGASKALGTLGNAVGSIVTDLTSKSNMKAGDNLLSSISGVLKSSSPGAVNQLGQVAKDMTAINTAISSGQKKGGSLQEAGRVYDDIIHGFSTAYHSIRGATAAAGGDWKVASNQYNKTIHPTLTVKAPDIKNLSGAKLGLGGGKLGTFPMHVKVQTEGASQAKSELQAIHKAAGKSSKTEIKASVTGAAKAKSDLKTLHAAAGKSATEHLKVSLTGASQAKSDLQAIQKSSGKTTTSNVQVHLTGLEGARSQLDSLRTKLTQSWPSPNIKVNLTGAQQAATQLGSLGTAANSMASAVNSGASRAVAAVSGMASQMRGAISSLPGQFSNVGKAAGQGMASGIEASTGAAVSAAASMARQVSAAAHVALEVHSPSKVFQRLGASTIDGYILGLEGGKSAVTAALQLVLGNPFRDATITSTVSKIRKEISTLTWSWNPKKAYEGTQLTQLLDTDNGKLMKLARQRQSLISQIKAADALASSVQAAAIAGADVTKIAPNTQAGLIQANLASSLPGSSQNPFTSIQQGLQQQLGQIKQFRADIVKLKKEGLDKGSIKQLLAAGVSGGGLSTAEQMIGEGAGGVKAIAKLQEQIAKASKQLGVTGANAAYESGSQIGEGLAAGLKSALKSVDSAMANIAKTLVTSLMTALGASSKDIKAAIKKLDKELGIGSGSSGGSGGGETMHGKPIKTPTVPHLPGPIQNGPIGVMRPAATVQPIIVYVQVDGKTIARTVQTAALQHANRNPQTYPNLPGRAA